MRANLFVLNIRNNISTNSLNIVAIISFIYVLNNQQKVAHIYKMEYIFGSPSFTLVSLNKIHICLILSWYKCSCSEKTSKVC